MSAVRSNDSDPVKLAWKNAKHVLMYAGGDPSGIRSMFTSIAIATENIALGMIATSREENGAWVVFACPENRVNALIATAEEMGKRVQVKIEHRVAAQPTFAARLGFPNFKAETLTRS